MDNASQDNTSSVLDRYEQRQRLPLVRLTSALRRSRTALLNEAIASARGNILIFLHEDHLVPPDFLLQHLLLHLKEECVVLGDDHRRVHTHLFAPDEPAQNGIMPQPFVTPDDLDDPQQMALLTFPGQPNYGPLFAYFAQQQQSPPHPWACFSLANASVPHAALERLGGFDETFSGWGLEETDLAYRLHQAGLPFRYAPRAVTLRQLAPGLPGSRRDLLENVHHFCGKYPHLTPVERALVRRASYAPQP